MYRIVPLIAGLLALQGTVAPAATVLFCPFDSLQGWSIQGVGATAAGISGLADGTPSAEVGSHRGTVFLTRDLPAESVAGCRVSVNCLVKSDSVVAGPQSSSTAKVHLAVETPHGVQHHIARFTGTTDWHLEGLTADVPSDAVRVVLNLGLEACRGRAWFRRLTVQNDRRGIHKLDLTGSANAGHRQLGFHAFPKGVVEWDEIPFDIIDSAKHYAGDCLRLRGVGHEDWPERTATPIAVNTGATAIYILHGALSGRETADTPCAIWSANFAGGQDYSLSLFEGRQIGAIGRTEDLENWHVAWHENDADGNPVSFGVTKWIIYSDTPVVSLDCEAYGGAPPVVLAVTVVEDPPPPPSEAVEYDEMGDILE